MFAARFGGAGGCLTVGVYASPKRVSGTRRETRYPQRGDSEGRTGGGGAVFGELEVVGGLSTCMQFVCHRRQHRNGTGFVETAPSRTAAHLSDYGPILSSMVECRFAYKATEAPTYRSLRAAFLIRASIGSAMLCELRKLHVIHSVLIGRRGTNTVRCARCREVK